MVLDSQIPGQVELVRRASELVPVLRSHATWTEENRRLHEESVEALTAAGVFKLRLPRRYGGYERDTRTLVEVAAELARGDGSTAWTASVYGIAGWMACMFPDEVQDEVFSTPDVRVCGTLSPSGMAIPTDGGLVLNGKWGFITGAWHSQWQVVVAVTPVDGGHQPILGMVPMSELQIVDDWHTSGLSGTGSVTTVARDVFLPAERVLSMGAVLAGQYGSAHHADSPVYRTPLLPTAAASSVGAVVGMAKAAMDAFLERLPGRGITYTGYASQAEAPVTHFQVAEAALLIDEAEFHARRLASQVDGKGIDGSAWTLAERVRARADMGRVCQLAKQAVDVLNTAGGGSSIHRSVPIQRIARDVQAVNLHALMHPNTNMELYGRILCGQDPNTLYI
ncbi:acyl-CoA dehydrogenase family protein [Saccharothrix luteola]|uniref:acyl-CoA dehydrogenase family protein n=1 Tax=Saccharothrix luteola TaxID=2893018 RepID=UPI001E583C69|nr:acyl-CoA dehydrogenase family protein [Saccharothrix luteola]MCC8249763.1 acyl-CoA dehydrogenase family protein [Saccharothrix luteola]